MVEQLEIFIHKRHQEVTETYLKANGLIYQWTLSGRERVGFSLQCTDDVEPVLKLVVMLIWLSEQRCLLDWAENEQMLSYSRWEKIKFRRRIAEIVEADLSILQPAVRSDLKRLNWAKKSIDIKGFVRFAASSLQQKMRALGEAYFEIYQEEKERTDFAEVLQSFVQMQEPVVAVADVLWSEHEFEVRDEKGCDLKAVYRTSMLLERLDEPEETTPEDFLLSILITVVPSRVVIHLQGACPKESLSMVEKVFADRLYWCTGCGYCQ